MAVSLASLKVAPEFDASGYIRGATAKVDADGKMIAADKARIIALQQADVAMARVAQRLVDYGYVARENARATAEVIQLNQAAGRSWEMTGIEAANLANHVKTATIALYALSPQFRALVNPAITASVKAMGPAAASAAGAALSAFSPLLATIGRLALPIGIAVESFRAMAAITELGAQKLAEFNDLAAKAAGAGVGTDFLQRQIAGAKEFSLEANLATDALKRFRDVDQAQLGGSPFEQRLEQLTKAGNFAGNAGIAALRQATDVETRYRAAVDLISTALERGERLAALDLAAKFLPAEILDRLRASGGALRDLQAAADAAKPADIVDAAQIGYALDLKRRLQEADETLANSLKPVQRDLTQLGLNYQESWISIREAMAGGVTSANSLYSALKEIPDIFARAGSASFWTRLTEYTEKLGLNSKPEGLTLPGQPGFANDNGTASLAAALRNREAVRLAMEQATRIQTAVRGDLSLNPSAPPAQRDANDAVDRAIDSLRKHVEVQNADAAAMGLGAAALARFRAEAAETAAIQANGGKITAEQAAQFAVLKQRAADAALALEKARVGESIRFGRQTSLLSPEDVQIAQQLRGIYPDVATALNSVEAAGLRTNQALSGLSSQISGQLVTGLADINDGTKSISNGARDMGKVVVRAIEEMIIKLYIVIPLMRALQSSIGGPLAGLLGGGASGGNVDISGNAYGQAFGSNVVPFARGSVFTNKIFDAPTLFRFAYGGGMGNGVMGEAGPEAVMPLRRGADGRLGVSLTGGGGAIGNSSGFGVVFNGGIQINVPEGTSPTDASAIGRTVRSTMEQVVDERIRYHARARGALATRA